MLADAVVAAMRCQAWIAAFETTESRRELGRAERWSTGGSSVKRGKVLGQTTAARGGHEWSREGGAGYVCRAIMLCHGATTPDGTEEGVWALHGEDGHVSRLILILVLRLGTSIIPRPSSRVCIRAAPSAANCA